MEFGLSEEQELLQQTIRGFIERECPPPRLREIFDAGSGHDPSMWAALAEMGVTGLMVPEIHGGAGLESLDLALVCEAMGEGALPIPLIGHSLASLAIAEGDSEIARSAWLPRLADGSAIGTVALCEEASAWEPEAWRARVVGGVLSGCKLYVPHADLAQILIVGLDGGGLALVEAGSPGVKFESQGGADRTRPVFRVDFDSAPCSVLSADPRLASRVRDVGLALLAADAFGAATRLVDMAVAYSKTREQFGRKIAEFQAVKHQIARLGLDVEPTRALHWYAAYAVDHLPDDGERAAALAKSHITDRAIHTARMVVELHGGFGFTWECDVQMWFKRVMFDRAFLGTPESLRERCAVLSGW
jgi:alkylation response protein AidB-like acyl-CoA dehydrogenase